MADIAAGKFVVVTDDADRENEGDLIMAADRMTEEAMAFMVSICIRRSCNEAHDHRAHRASVVAYPCATRAQAFWR